MDGLAEKIRSATLARVGSLMSKAKWGADALPKLGVGQLRLLVNTLIDAYSAGFLAGQVRERIAARQKATEEFFGWLEGPAEQRQQ